MDTMFKVKAFKLVGDIISNPDKFLNECQILACQEFDDKTIEVTLKIGGSLGALLRDVNHVKRALEEKSKNPILPDAA